MTLGIGGEATSTDINAATSYLNYGVSQVHNISSMEKGYGGDTYHDPRRGPFWLSSCTYSQTLAYMRGFLEYKLLRYTW